MPVFQPDVAAPSALIERRSSEKIWWPAFKDYAGNPIANGAGHVPVKPLFQLTAIAVYHFTIFRGYTDANFRAHINAVNSDTWRVWPPYSAWISEIHSDGVKTLGSGGSATSGEEIRYVVRCIDRQDGWRLEYPNVGWAYDDGGDFTPFDGFIGNLDAGGGDAGGTLSILTADMNKQTAFTPLFG